MFTGLITRVGSIATLSRGTAGGYRIAIDHPRWDEVLTLGESISVMGVCLTAVHIPHDGHFVADLLDETLNRTALKFKVPGAPVNLERALRPMDRLGGHFVSGHVDGTGILASTRPAGRDTVFRVECDSSLTREMVVKGSIACDGISLTLTLVEERAFEMHVIPHTLESTALGSLRVGDAVNLETDILGKYALKSLQAGTPTRITLQTLSDAGFIPS